MKRSMDTNKILKSISLLENDIDINYYSIRKFISILIAGCDLKKKSDRDFLEKLKNRLKLLDEKTKKITEISILEEKIIQLKNTKL